MSAVGEGMTVAVVVGVALGGVGVATGVVPTVGVVASGGVVVAAIPATGGGAAGPEVVATSTTVTVTARLLRVSNAWMTWGPIGHAPSLFIISTVTVKLPCASVAIQAGSHC